MNQKQISNPLSNSQLNSIHELVDEVGTRQLQDFGQINSDLKPDGTLITECDRWSDKTIVKGLDTIASGEGVLSEEGNKSIPNSNEYWVVDPLDGTTVLLTILAKPVRFSLKMGFFLCGIADEPF